MSFNFTGETPNAQLFTDVQNLNAFNETLLGEFVEIALSFLAHNSNSTQQLEDFAAANGVNSKALNSTLRGLLYFFSESLKQNLSSEKVQSDLTALGMREDKAELLSNLWSKRFVALSSMQIDKTLKVHELVDMEWKFGVTASNNEVSEVGACFLQLKLTLDQGGGKRESKLMELTLPQFYQFLQEMQQVSRLVK